MPSSPPKPLRRFRKSLLRALGAGLLLGLAGWFALPWAVPWPASLDQPVPAGLKLTDRDGRPLRRMLSDGRRAGEPLPLTSIPPALVQATLAAEDRRFFSHGGVDFLALARAARDSFAARRRVSGASTITQQLVKLVVPRPRTLRTKLLEILTARRIEMTWDKEQILEQYLNRLDYGNLHRGPAAASPGYFGKPLSDCSPAECAFLAGLPQAPSRLNPWKNPDRAVRRQHWILDRLQAIGALPASEIERARTEPLRLRRHYGAFAASHFADLLLNTPAAASDPPPPTDGDWRTTLDLTLQETCGRIISDRLARLRSRNVTQAAVVVIENAGGEIRALIGSQDYHGADAGQVNGTTARRSPGSALKPFTYLLALQEEDSPATILPDLAIEYMTESGLYRPQNYNHRAAGPVSLRTALANSLNLSAVRTLQSHGGPAALVESLQAAGLTTLTKPAAAYGLGLTIGGGEVTLLELTAAYSTLARLGIRLPPRFTPPPVPPAGTRIYDPDACWLMADILADNEARVRSFGPDSALRLPFPCAVKTGTSTDYRDNWTIGYTPSFTVGVWVGNFDGSPMRGVSGVTGATPVFREIMAWLDARDPAGWYPRPPSILERQVDPLTGLPIPPELSGKRPEVTEKFRRDLAPRRPDPERYDAAGRIRLPAEYAAWLAGPDNWLGAGAAVAATPGSDSSWRIVSPLPGTTVLLDPDLPHGGRQLSLRLSPEDPDAVWFSPTLEIHGRSATLTPGRHEITVRNPTTGRGEATWIQVRPL